MPEFGDYGPTIQSFLDDSHFIRVIVGGRGSGKTRALAEDVHDHITLNPGAKVIIARETEISQADSSIDTFLQFYDDIGGVYRTEATGLFAIWNNGRKIRVPSRLALERAMALKDKIHNRSDVANWIKEEGESLCGYIHFRGLPDAEKGKFRGMECSYLALIEADQISRKQFELSLACLRWKGSDPSTCTEKGFIKDQSVVLDTNPPGTKHWIALLEDEESKKPETDRTMRFWHIPTRENEHNLPENYIRDTIMLPYANNPAMIRRMRDGEYADAFDGNAVYYNFSQTEHVWNPQNDEERANGMDWPLGSYLIEGYDFGTCNAVVWLAYWQEGDYEYIRAMAEQYTEGSDTDRQGREAIRARNELFPFWNDRTICSGVLSFCDPAGENSSYTQSHNSAGQKVANHVDILRTHGIQPGSFLWQRGIAKGIAVINRFLQKRDSKGRSCFMIDAHACPILTAALSGGYRYPKDGEPGFGGEEPLKGTSHQDMDYSHICFIAGTLITTLRGEIPVEQIQDSDVALTRNGWRQITAKMRRQAAVITAHLSDGRTLTGTPDHPVWSETQNRMIPLAKLTPFDTLCSCTQNLLHSTAKNTADTLNPNVGLTDSTSNNGSTTSTGTYGAFTTDQSPKESTFTTETEIRSTTTSQISNVLPPKNTFTATGHQNDLPLARSIAKRSDHSRSNGINQRKDERGTATTPAKLDSEKPTTKRKLVTTANDNSSSPPLLAFGLAPDFAPTTAKPHSDEQAALTMKTANAFSATSHSDPTNTAQQKPVHVVALERLPEEHEVFNITVADSHEYFANGILVSNCDSFRYPMLNVLKLMKAEMEATKAPNFRRKTKSLNPRRRV